MSYTIKDLKEFIKNHSEYTLEEKITLWTEAIRRIAFELSNKEETPEYLEISNYFINLKKEIFENFGYQKEESLKTLLRSSDSEGELDMKFE